MLRKCCRNAAVLRCVRESDPDLFGDGDRLARLERAGARGACDDDNSGNDLTGKQDDLLELKVDGEVASCALLQAMAVWKEVPLYGCVRMRVRARARARVCACLCVRARVRVRTCTCMCVCMCVQGRVCVCR